MFSVSFCSSISSTWFGYFLLKMVSMFLFLVPFSHFMYFFFVSFLVSDLRKRWRKLTDLMYDVFVGEHFFVSLKYLFPFIVFGCIFFSLQMFPGKQYFWLNELALQHGFADLSIFDVHMQENYLFCGFSFFFFHWEVDLLRTGCGVGSVIL